MVRPLAPAPHEGVCGQLATEASHKEAVSEQVQERAERATTCELRKGGLSYSTELAAAARRVRALVEQLPEQQRPDVVAEWSDLIDQLDGKSDHAARATIATWLEHMEIRLASALDIAHAVSGDESPPKRTPIGFS